MAPVDGGGNASRPSSPIPVTGQEADAPQVNVPVDDIYAILNMFPFLDGRKSWRGNQNLNGYKITNAANGSSPQDYVTVSQMQDAIASVSFLFPGFMQIDTATSTVTPQGWLYANGQEVLRATYPDLWVRVSNGNNIASTQGTKTHGQYGPGNGTTTFTLPNMYGATTSDGGYFIRAVSSGRAIGTVQQDENKEHSHSISDPGHSHGYTARSGIGSVTSGPSTEIWQGTTVLQTTQSGTGISVNTQGIADARPKNIAYPVLIKT